MKPPVERDEAAWQAWLSSETVVDEPEKLKKHRNWREILSSSAELAGILSVACGFGWFSPGLGLMAGGAGLAVVGFLYGIPPKENP